MNNESDGKFLPFFHHGLTEELRLKAKNELNETEDKKRNGLQALRQYIEKNKHLPLELSDEFLLAFLRVAKFNLEKCQKRLEKYCAIRRKTNFIEKMDESMVKYYLDNHIIGGLPYRTADGCSIMYTRPYAWTPELGGGDLLGQLVFVSIHLLLCFEPTTVSGAVYLMDCNVTSKTYVYELYNNMIMKHIWNWLAMPIRIRRICCLNTNPIGRFFYQLIRPFLPKKVENRIRVTGPSAVEDFIPASILHNEFEGTMGSLIDDPFQVQFRDRFLQCVKKMKEEDHIFKCQR